jgi:hypothetical protein
MRDGLAALWVERPERNVSIDNVARIARGLKVKPWILLDDNPKP